MKMPMLLALAAGIVGACSSSDAKSGEGTDAVADAGEADVVVDAAAPEGGPDCTGEECAIFPESCVVGGMCPVATPPLDPRTTLFAAAGSAADVWIVGTTGTVLRFDGSSFRLEPFVRRETFRALLVRSSNETWIGGSLLSSYVGGATASDGGGAFERVAQDPLPIRIGEDFGVFEPLASENVNIRGLWSQAGSEWTWVALGSVYANLPTLARVRRQGAKLTRQNVVPADIGVHLSMNALAGISNNELFAVGERGMAYRINGADSASPLITTFNTKTDASLNGVAVVGSDDVWAVGNMGVVRRYRGGGLTWESVEGIPTIETLYDVKVVSPSDIWIVGDRATVLHFDGAQWSRIPVGKLVGLRPALHAVLPLGPGRVLAVGERIVLELRTSGGG